MWSTRNHSAIFLIGKRLHATWSILNLRICAQCLWVKRWKTKVKAGKENKLEVILDEPELKLRHSQIFAYAATSNGPTGIILQKFGLLLRDSCPCENTSNDNLSVLFTNKERVIKKKRFIWDICRYSSFECYLKFFGVTLFLKSSTLKKPSKSYTCLFRDVSDYS